jgi:hypothetical protein
VYRQAILETAERRYDASDPDEFDRIAFAMRALSVLRPRRMTVAVYPSVSSLRVERGRDLAASAPSTWAMVGIPPDASRETIALALAELAGFGRRPFVVELLVHAGRQAEEDALVRHRASA